MTKPKLIIHGGAGQMEGSMCSFKDYHKALIKIIQKTYPTLLQEGSRAAVIQCVRALEDNPMFNAGKGSKLQRDGQVRMCAAIMSSDDNKFSGVVNIRNVRHPISVADLLNKEKHTVIGGNEATDFARQNDFKYFNPITEHRLKEFKEAMFGDTGTVGVVALDDKGVMSVGTSTGGVGHERPGRIGDSATVAGTYASKYCGVSCTGKGEHIMNQAVAARIVTRVEDGKKLDGAVKGLIKESDKMKYHFGMIAMDKKGNVVVNGTKYVNVLYATYDGDNIETFLNQNDKVK
jgi:L-asparaginase